MTWRDTAPRPRSRLDALVVPPRASGAGPAAPVTEQRERTRSSALADAAARYADAHGTLPGPEPERHRTRWTLSVRTVLVATIAFGLVVGAVTLRAVATRPGEPVALPVPAATASPAPEAPVEDATSTSDDGTTGTTTSGTMGATTGPVTAPGLAAQVVVDVVGAVRRPGVVRLPVGSRVVDAVDAAGGAASGADLARLNLARVLVDGEQIVVPRPGDPVVAPPASPEAPADAVTALVDLNTADQSALEDLPGIGPVLAGRIVTFRAATPFATVEDLLDVPGIGPALFEQLRTLVQV